MANRPIGAAIRVIIETTLMACGLGICLDLVTANIAVEYFSVFHPHVVDSDSPFVMALIWGVGASWWFGLICGLILVAPFVYKAQPIPIALIRRTVAKACIAMWLIFMGMLLFWYVLIGILPIPRHANFEYNRRLMTVAFTHFTEYLVGAIALVVVFLRVRFASRPLESSDV